MTLHISPTELTFFGPALPAAFVQHELEKELGAALPSAKQAETAWQALRRALNEPLLTAGALRVRNVILQPLATGLGYEAAFLAADAVPTREGNEPGGYLLSAGGVALRLWSYAYETDLDAPTLKGQNHRYAPLRIAERVLLASGERLGLITNGVEIRLVFSDPARRASYASFALGEWKRRAWREPPPDAFRLLLALASPAGIGLLPKIIDEARLKQGQVTKDLRSQARKAIEGFIQGLLDHPANQARLQTLRAERGDAAVASELWHDALILVYRLLFILRGETGGRETPPFSFASQSLWRNTYSPSRYQSGSLAWAAEKLSGKSGLVSGSFMENGLRALFRLFEGGLSTPELNIPALGGALFGPHSAPLVESLDWGETGCALLLDSLLRAPRGKGKARSLVRISYRDLDVEELGRVYEALLELEPGISAEAMCRLRRAKLEVVVPLAQGEKYRPAVEPVLESIEVEAEPEDEEPGDEESEEKPSKKTKIEWIEAIPAGRFYLRVGLGRKASGSYYTPESFVKFLVQETLGPLCDERSPADDPQPRSILKLNVLDPAMGSGHFLVGACRFLGERLYDACRAAAEKEQWERIPEEIVPYMPGRRPEGESEAGFSTSRAQALCRRFVAVHCLYGVDKNALAVELARVSLWLESFAEGLPLTFLDHRLVCGDSLLGPLNITGDGPDSPLMPPYANTPLDAALTANVRERLKERLQLALQKVETLDASLGVDAADLAAKHQAKQELDAALRPFVELCQAWSGGIMLGPEQVNDAAYRQALEILADDQWDDAKNALPPSFLKLLIQGRRSKGLVFSLIFPEVFFLEGLVEQAKGFDTILGNPPWDQVEVSEPEFWARYDLGVLAAPTPGERTAIQTALAQKPENFLAWREYLGHQMNEGRFWQHVYIHQITRVNKKATSGKPDAYRLFSERAFYLLTDMGFVGFVLPSAFHANEGATGIRQLFLSQMEMVCCYSFENKRSIFDIHKSFKFSTIVSQKNKTGSTTFKTAFYLCDDGWLFDVTRTPEPLVYSRTNLENSGGGYLVFPECRSQYDFDILAAASQNSFELGKLIAQMGIDLRQGMSVTREAWRRSPILNTQQSGLYLRETSEGEPAFIVHEGKTFSDYTDTFETQPKDVVTLSKLSDRAHWGTSIRYFRLSQRLIASSTNERTSIFAILPPGIVCVHSARIEATPEVRPTSKALLCCAYWNSFSFDFLSRVRVGSNVSEYIVQLIPMKLPGNIVNILVHAALRLVCNHSGFEPLWKEQFRNKWCEPTPPHTWPVLAGDDARWQVRAAIDVVVAQAYGLNREQYAHVLSTFSHKSYPKAPVLCLAMFNELSEIGLEAFTRKYDPYWDVPLVESLPQPVIELPIFEGAEDTGKSKGRKRQVREAGGAYQVDMFGEVGSITPSDKKQIKK